MGERAPAGRPYHGDFDREDDPARWRGPHPGHPGPRGQQAPRRRRGGSSSRILSVLLGAALLLLALIGGATAFLVFSLPTSVVRNYLATEVKAQTGRDLVVEGPSSFTLVPNVGVVLGNVTLLAPPGAGGIPTVTIGSLLVRVQILPLLSHRVVIEKLVLRDPVFDLRTDKNGHHSWQIAASERHSATAAHSEVAPAPAAEPAPEPAPKGTAALKDFGAAKLARLEQLELGRLFIKNGTVRYRDERTGAHGEATGIDVRIGMTSLLSPVHLAGSLVWAGEKLSVRGSLESLKDLFEARPARLTAKVEGQPVSASYEGDVTLHDGFALDGELDVEAPSTQDLASWLNRKLPPSVSGPLSVSARVKADRKSVTLANATLTLDRTAVTGDLGIDTTGARPYVTGNLEVAELDLDRRAEREAVAPQPAPATAESEAHPPALPKSIEDLMDEPAARAKGSRKRAGWSERPLALAGLEAIDADVKLAIRRLRARDLAFGASVVNVALRDKVLKATLADAPFYGGRARGSFTLDARNDVAAVAVDLSADAVGARAFLGDTAGVDWLAGTGKLNLALTAQGNSERQIMERLGGRAEFVVTNGAFIGWSLTEFLEGLRHGHLQGLEPAPTAKTEFTELGGSFTVAGGVATSNDLRLASPNLQMSGAGKLHLAERRMDYVLTPKLVVTSGAQKNLVSIEVPVRVEGPWESPRFAPDLPGALGDPDKAKEALREIRKKYKGKSANEIVKDLLGTEAQDGEIKVKPKKLLEEFLKPNAARQ